MKLDQKYEFSLIDIGVCVFAAILACTVMFTIGLNHGSKLALQAGHKALDLANQCIKRLPPTNEKPSIPIPPPTKKGKTS